MMYRDFTERIIEKPIKEQEAQTMDAHMLNTIANFIWGIADDCLRDVYVRGKYRDVILPMTVIRRLDAVLEDTKQQVLDMKKVLDGAGITNQWGALCNAAGQAFCNSSPFCLRDLTSRPTAQKLKVDFEAYLDGFSPNVQEILEKFKFRNQIDTMVEADILGAVIQKFVSKDINLSPKQHANLPGLDNHAMGTIFEELVRRFNEANNEEAGEHWTPRDVVELMADLVFAPIADQIKDATYSCYDGACGTGGMLTVAQERLNKIAAENGKKVSIHLFGQELQAETYAIAKADMMLKGDGEEAMHIAFGSTLSSDQHAARSFDFMLANPPYGKSWKTDAERMASGKKKEILDTRFNAATTDGEPLAMIPRSSDGQLLFLLNNISKMKRDTPLGSRIAEVHNGSSLFTGDAGSGESNARRFMIENDLVEAIIALPENMFYNTNMATYIWVLSNRKQKHRKGRIQLIDATGMKTVLKRNMGKKNCMLSSDACREIVRIFIDMEPSENSKILDNSEFGYYRVNICVPMLDEDGIPMRDKNGSLVPDKSKSDNESIPFNYPGGEQEYLRNEVWPFLPNAWIDHGKTKIGYEIRFTRYFHHDFKTADISQITAKIQDIQKVLATPFLLNSYRSYSQHTSLKEIWISEIPAHWEAIKIKYLFDERSEKGHPDEPLLAATQNMGVVPKDLYGLRTVEATKDLHLLKLVRKDDFVISLRSFQGGIERAYYQGIISPAYTIMIPKGISVQYFKHLAKTKVFIDLLQQCVTGVREGQNIDYKMLRDIRIPVPPIKEQLQIAKFLDSIDARIDARKREIALLEQYKSAIASDIVTGRIDVSDIEVPNHELVEDVVEGQKGEPHAE